MALMIGAPTGSLLDPSVFQPPEIPQAQPPPQAAPPAVPAQPYKPNFLDILQGVVFNGQSPAEAAMSARGRDFALQQQRYGLQRQQMLMETLRNATPDQRLAMLLNPEKLGEAVSSRFTSMAMKGGETRDNGEGGPASRTAPLMGFDDKSGSDYSITPGKMISSGQSLGGDISVSPTGIVNSGRTGPTGQAISLPQLKPLGSSLESFTPGLSGGPSGLPALASAPARSASALPAPVSAKPGSAAILNPQGGVDPVAFFKSFVRPHEGGWNARDLNGSPTNHGFNQAANGDIDVRSLTPETAAARFAAKNFPQSGAAQLPPALAVVHADTAFINPSKAHEFLAASGGDPSKYMDLRDQWMGNLVAKHPAAQQYAQAWSNRNADLRALAGQFGGAQSSGHGATVRTLSPAATPQLLAEGDPRLARFPKGTVVQQNPNGELSVVQPTEYSPAERSKIRQQFLESEGYKGHVAASSALQALTANIGKMNGPSAYSILDTFARTINPGAVARQGTLSAIEDSLGLPAHLVGSLQNIVGQGKIPLQTQQQILNAVTPFAQAHYDQAKRFYDANVALAKARHFDPDEVTAPIGERPQNMIAAPGGAISHDAAILSAKAAIAKGADRARVIQRLHAMGVDPKGL